uniref:Putative ATPase domain containing protein n=1 Tax=viral metagenome TaxID=1070528 RepID=A0A6M3L034_9ZZZZ
MTDIPVGKPEVTYGIYRNTFEWVDIDLSVVADRITEDGKAELYFYHNNGTGKRLLHMGNANLLSSTMQREFTKALSTRGMDVDWQTVLTYIARNTMERLRQGEPVNIIAGQPNQPSIIYTVKPILEMNLPTTIYGPGASAKSYLADLIAVMVQFGYSLDMNHFIWTSQQGNVLYLDWESNQRDHERRVWAIKQGLGLKDEDTECTLFYRRCTQPLVTDLPTIQQLVFDNDIVLIVVDSQMAASGYGLDHAQIASQFYNGLNSLKCTSLTIDHMSKEEWKGQGDSVAPYGSVVKYNRCRSLYEVQKRQYSGESYVDIAMVHRKHNEGMLRDSIGMRIFFYSDENNPDQLAKVEFEWTDPEDVIKRKDQEAGTRSPDIKELIEEYLEEQPEAKAIKAIAEAIKHPEASIRTILNRYPQDFVSEQGMGKAKFWKRRQV